MVGDPGIEPGTGRPGRVTVSCRTLQRVAHSGRVDSHLTGQRQGTFSAQDGSGARTALVFARRAGKGGRALGSSRAAKGQSGAGDLALCREQ